MIDLHTHTTASDGRYPPAEVVARAAAVGVTTLAVTDHDTLAGCAEAAAASAGAGIRFICGIEVTAVLESHDVHLLGYFVDTGHQPLLEFLVDQRRRRIDRAVEMLDRLAGLGISLDREAILSGQARAADTAPPAGTVGEDRAIGRPQIARALVAAGHATSTDEAFARWLGRGRPAFVTRVGPTPAAVVRHLHDAGGIVSLAHPGLTRVDDQIGEFVERGLDALEAYHSRHDVEATARYRQLARQYGLLITGGSDFHGDPHHGPDAPGRVSLPEDEFHRLLSRTRHRE